MRRKSRQHPLQSFHFWFLVFAGVSAGTAWKLGWLPLHQHDEHPDTAQTPVPITDESPEFDSMGADSLDSLMLSQSEPEQSFETGAPARNQGTGTFYEEPMGTREIPPVSPVAENPFGVARPEFTAIDGQGVTPNAGVRGDIQLTASEEPAPVVEPVDPVPTVDLTDVRALLAAGTPEAEVEAHRLLSEMYWSNPAVRPQLMEHLEATARRIYFLPQPHYMDACTVQPGDNLQSIAEQYDITWQYLARLNRITDARRLRAGQNLKVIRGPFTAIVDLSDYELTIHAHGYFVFRFPVGIGRDGSTPEGSFFVEEKLVNPVYYGPDGVIASDDPLNPLGERWIGIGNSYGIHGTIEPESIGRSESRGCIRLHNPDVEIVYDLLSTGSEVIIQR